MTHIPPETQIIFDRASGRLDRLHIPSASTPLFEDVVWGDVCSPKSAAFWYAQLWYHRHTGEFTPRALGRNLIEEVAACLLGGYGMPAEIGWAAFEAVRDEGLLERLPTITELTDVLSRPFLIAGKAKRYRFVGQKSRFLASCLHRLRNDQVPHDPLELRDYLVSLPGIGPKTASWVVRNRFACNDVAILDVHVVRLCKLLGVFPESANPQKDYAFLERQFVAFARAMKVAASELDNLIWHHMKTIGRAVVS